MLSCGYSTQKYSKVESTLKKLIPKSSAKEGGGGGSSVFVGLRLLFLDAFWLTVLDLKDKQNVIGIDMKRNNNDGNINKS